MNLIDNIKISIDAILANKLRSSLTTLGVIIGIAAVIVMVSLGKGAENLIIGQIASLGSNTIFIEPGAWDPKKGFGKGEMMRVAMEEMELTTLKYEDAIAIEKDPLIEFAAPVVFGVDRVVYKNIDKKVSFMGTTPAASKINEVSPILGRDLTESDVKTMAKVAVLGFKIKKDLFGEENPLGKKIRIKNISFRVVGVMEEQGVQAFMNLDEIIYIPVTTAQKLLLGIDHVRWILAKAKEEKYIDQAVENIRLILRERHNISNPENDLSKDDFKVMSQKETAKILSTVTSVLTIFLSLIAAIALLVGGIGIMNIMLVSVTERTKEIGLRKAVGAKNKDILDQFLTEAVILTILGGIGGIIIGVLSSAISVELLQYVGLKRWKFFIPYSIVLLSFFICTAVGIIFGIYPAKKAANMDPIKALRYE